MCIIGYRPGPIASDAKSRPTAPHHIVAAKLRASDPPQVEAFLWPVKLRLDINASAVFMNLGVLLWADFRHHGIGVKINRFRIIEDDS